MFLQTTLLEITLNLYQICSRSPIAHRPRQLVSNHAHAFGIIIYICNMKGIVITVKNSSEFKFLSELLKKLGISSTIVSVEEMEDIGLYKLMKSADRNKKVSREKIMSKLKS